MTVTAGGTEKRGRVAAFTASLFPPEHARTHARTRGPQCFTRGGFRRYAAPTQRSSAGE